MDRDNISALAMAIAVVAVIVGFGVYFNSPSLNKASSQQQLEKVISAATTTSGTIKTIKLDKAQFLRIDKSQFQKAPEFVQIAGSVGSCYPVCCHFLVCSRQADGSRSHDQRRYVLACCY